MDLIKYNEVAWDHYVINGNRWTLPVSGPEIEKAKKGEWNIVLTPTKPVPKNWFPNPEGLQILGLASGGGQQCPILAALGAQVTVFDNSSKQLGQDAKVAETFGLNLQTVQGDMRDLSVFKKATFDIIFNPCSVLFVDDVKGVWKECYRILKPNGILMTGLINPVTFQLQKNGLTIVHKQPYTDLYSLPEDQLEELQQSRQPMVFGHSFTDQISGQLEAGFMITDMYEDNWGGENTLDEFLPSFMATRAIKKSVKKE